LLNGQVTGQDAGHAIRYRGKLYWFWGDTNQLAYPLGNFASSGATSELPGNGGLDPNVGIDLNYFVNETGFSRAMAPLPGAGLKWVFWMMTVADEQGRERLIAQYERMGQAGKAAERGLVLFNDETQQFEKLVQFALKLPLHPNGRPFRVNVNGEAYYYFAVLYPDNAFVRVRAEFAHLKDQCTYEAFTCLVPGSRYNKASSQLERRADGSLVWGWKANTDAISYERERELIKVGKMHPFFDQDGGRVIFFEGTYTNLFSGNAVQTPRYDYNQIMYRLRLDDARLSLPAPVYIVNGQYRMQEEMGEQWAQIESIPFFAVPPAQKTEVMIPIYAVTEQGRSRLQREAPDNATPPLFYALPVASAQDSLSGEWQCKLQEAGGDELPFALELKVDGEQVTGKVAEGVITRGSLRGDQLTLEVKTAQEVYELTAQIQAKRWRGTWRIQSTDKHGVWSGERAVEAVSPALVPLYEYRHVKDGVRVYATTAQLPGKAFRRAALSRVAQSFGSRGGGLSG
jgi:hypothetical protein